MFSAYEILVSEIMLQQTQATRVIPKYQTFLSHFPTIADLTRADTAQVIRLWSGLGYNRRAKYLRDAAVELIQAQEPWSSEALVACKGIGENTAGAIRVYAYNIPEVFIETNIRTVYIHHFFPRVSDITDGQIRDVVSRSLDTENPREFYWALMDYGAYLKRSGVKSAQKSKLHTVQSPFSGSWRQVRGAVLRELTTRDTVSMDALKHIITDPRLEKVVQQLKTEGLVHQRNNMLSL